MVFWLLDDWPCRFIDVCRDAGFTRSHLAEMVFGVPFWLSSVTDEYLDNRHYIPQADEILSAGRYLEAHHMEVSVSTLTRALNLSPGLRYQAWHIWQNNNQDLFTKTTKS